jgi:ankyrin repeat protein
MSQMNIDLEGWDLHRAAKENTVDITRSLIARGDDVNSRDEDGYTPLHLAAGNNSLDVARLLVDSGADINTKDEDGDTPLHLSGWNNSLDVARLLIDSDAGIYAKNDDGWTALHTAAEDNSLDVATFLIDRGAEIDAKNNDGWSPLHIAVGNNSLDVARLLADRGADINTKDEDGWSPLHLAAQENSLDVARLLTEHGAEIEAKDNDGWAPLHTAAQNNSLDVARLLIEKDADIEVGYIEAESRWRPVKKKGLDNEDVYPFFLISLHPIWTPLGQAAFMDSIDVAEFLIKQGAEVRINNRIIDRETGEISYEFNAHGWTMSHHAAENNASKVLHLLLSDERIDIEATCTKYPMNGWRPLHVAVQGDQDDQSDLDEDILGGLDATMVLIENKAMIEVENGRGDTPFLHAIRGNSLKIMSLLIEQGADINARSHNTGDGPTGLELAADLKLKDMVTTLIKHGAEFG